MRWIVNYIRSCFCKHDWEYLGKAERFNSDSSELPCAITQSWRCRKCGYIMTHKL